jgi:hypothetical protein
VPFLASGFFYAKQEVVYVDEQLVPLLLRELEKDNVNTHGAADLESRRRVSCCARVVIGHF